MIKPVEGAATSFEDGFVGLSAALSRPVVRLTVPNGIRVLRPVMILHAQVGEGSWDSGYFEITIGESATLNVVDLYRGDGVYLRTEVARATVAEAGRLNWQRVQNESGQASHFSDVGVKLTAGAQLWLTQVNSGANWSRNTLRADVDGAEAEAHLLGLSFGKDQQHIDQRVVVNHHSSHTSSSQLFKGVLAGRSRGVLNGKIYIAPDAQKVSSRQMNHNILVGSGAEADTKPELEIYADDVKANHGASVGRIDGDKLFYLESRGIPRAEAERLLVEAFAADVVMKVPVPELRSLMETCMKELGR
jgi:Fe-S cluster assembly protein SufD